MAKSKTINVKAKATGTEKTSRKLGKIDKSIKSMGMSAVKAGAAFFGAQALISGLKASIRLAGEQEQVEKKLQTALGHVNKELLAQASAFQKQSKHGDETIISMMALASNMGIAEDKIGETTKMAIGLSEALGVDLNMAMKAAAGAIQGDTNMLTRYIPELKTTKDLTEKLEIVQRAANKGFEQSIKSTETMAGSMTQAGMAMGDAGEKIGSLLAPAVTDIATFLGRAAEKGGTFFQKMTETSLETSIRELQSLGINTLNLELAFAKAEAAKMKFKAVGLREEEQISKSLEDTANTRVNLITQLANEQANLLDASTSEEQLRKTIAEADEKIYGTRFGGVTLSNTQLGIDSKSARTKIEIIEKLQEQIKDQVTLIEQDQADLEIVQKAEASKEHILALEKAILENKKSQSDIEPDPVSGGIDALIMSEEQKASIRGEFNERFLEMTKGRYELENIELENAAQRFRDAGVEEIDVAQFIAERKKAIDADYKNSKISSVGSLIGAFGQLNQASKGSALVSKRLAQGEAAMNTWVAVNKALAAGVPPWNIIQATAIGAMGLANVVKIESQQFAEGGIVPGQGSGDTVPAMLTPGEVILNQAQQQNLVGGMGGVTINISAPLVDETVIDHIIPAIQKAHRMNLA